MLETNKPVNNPSQNDCDVLIDQLSKAFFIRSTDTKEAYPCVTGVHLNGLAVPVYTSKSKAESMSVVFSEGYNAETEVASITSLWDFLRLCAASGCEGVILDDSYPVTFFNRLSDRNRNWPTLMHMRLPGAETGPADFFFGRFGLVEPAPGAAVRWLNYEKLDRTSNRYVLRDNPLPEPIEAHAVLSRHGSDLIFPNGATFLGPYVSDVGAIPVFSHKSWAIYFSQVNGLCKSMDGDTVQLHDGYEISRIDLFQFLDSVRERHGPFVDLGLNPECHRFRQGWFFKENETWMLQTISGIWELSKDQPIRRSDVLPYKGYLGSGDSVSLIEQAASSVVASPFKRHIGSDRSHLSEDDANFLLDRELANSAEPIILGENESLPTDAFLVDAFDKISGESYAFSIYDDYAPYMGFLVFPDIVAAAAFLIHEVLPFDEQVRINGYELCHGGGDPGSQNSEWEAGVTESCIIALRKNLLDALTNGYEPGHAFQIKRLMQDVTATFELTEIGYMGDLVFYGTIDGGKIEDRIDMDEPSQERLLAKIRKVRQKISKQTGLPPDIETRLKSALGASLEQLAAETLMIAGSALDEFQRIGKRPGYDYAGISMKLSKLIERELSIRIFRPWRTAVRADIGKAGLAELRKEIEVSRDQTAARLIDWLEKKSKLELGSMRFCLRRAGEVQSGPSPQALLGKYLESMGDGEWLTSEALEDVLVDIATKYRNGGVHEHMVSFETCQEAMDRILLGSTPLLGRLIEETTVNDDRKA
jgi:hypothetical protein